MVGGGDEACCMVDELVLPRISGWIPLLASAEMVWETVGSWEADFVGEVEGGEAEDVEERC